MGDWGLFEILCHPVHLDENRPGPRRSWYDWYQTILYNNLLYAASQTGYWRASYKGWFTQKQTENRKQASMGHVLIGVNYIRAQVL